MIQKPGHWVPYELKPSVNGVFSRVYCFNGRKEKQGVIYYELLKPNKTVGDRYGLQLMRLSRSLKGKRSLYTQRHDKMILLHDNARPHVAKSVKIYLETFQWKVIPHPPYSPDIAPFDFHLFGSIAHGLADQRFHSYKEAKKWIDSWIASKQMSFFRRGNHILPERCKKVVASDGQYLE
ncbi:Mariner Mos1 transposase [Eumeta japonica]|uniref:Mariner Mos1 transposase n=1 Tax=Eumeta variegata TaxID=151549 RepID=A0A4C1V597_EUMVA|nr:Mariner Mos1 transposase [Eumeta japonica]